MFNPYFAAMALLAVAMQAWMLRLNRLNLRHMRSGCPRELEGLYTPEEQEKALAFQADINKYRAAASIVNVCVPLALLFLGAYGWLAGLAARAPGGLVAQAAVMFTALYLWSQLLGLPFGYRLRFGLLHKYGFNRSTKKLFAADQLKNLIPGLLENVWEPVAAAALFLYLGEWFWLALWALSCALSLIASYLYPVLIQPMFNKYTPLPEGELRGRALALAKQTGVPLRNIFVEDSSKRSSMGNAYFVGLGKSRRCVLYDTLLDKCTDGEILGILAHEIGHYKQKRLRFLYYAADFLKNGLAYFVLSLLVGSEGAARALGGAGASFLLGLAALGLLWRPLANWLQPLFVSIGRKMEYDADRHAALCGLGGDNISGLKKLYTTGLGNYNPHPLWVKWNDPHPTLAERVRFTEGLK
ncbi:MAG: M48 family metallopeptidase [Oscillospiraceae bacterium]|nr:M48 family metallopeptidase [Oscillospiraceae bacterium]